MTENDQKPTDQKPTIGAFNQLIRNQRNLRRVRVTPATSRDALNDALRRAAGHEPQHAEEEPESGTYPWRSLGSRDGDT
jgi:hypothetical protein